VTKSFALFVRPITIQVRILEPVRHDRLPTIPICSFFISGKTCRQYGQELVQRRLEEVRSASGAIIGPAGDAFLALEDFEGDIKPCPMCRVPIERDAGCAQMMCKRCKHVFCWYCLTSLDVRRLLWCDVTVLKCVLHFLFRTTFFCVTMTLGSAKESLATRVHLSSFTELR